MIATFFSVLNARDFGVQLVLLPILIDDLTGIDDGVLGIGKGLDLLGIRTNEHVTNEMLLPREFRGNAPSFETWDWHRRIRQIELIQIVVMISHFS